MYTISTVIFPVNLG